jgi:glycyl-tRNA synthetase alpha subunit
MFPDMTADDLVKPTPQMKALAVEYINAATVQERQSVVEKIKKLAKNRANLFTTESTRGSALQRMEPFTREP